jgi:hypothetical protein
VKDTTNGALLKAFIDRYKDTFHADMAQARLEELVKAGSTPSERMPGDNRGCLTRSKEACVTNSECAWVGQNGYCRYK